MKIKKIETNNKNKLIELQIIKSKLYKNVLGSTAQTIKISKTKLYIKKIAHIIYEYHINNKKILFINFPIPLQQKIYHTIKKTRQHIFINTEKDLITKKYQKYIDLIIQFNPNKDNSILSKNLANIPIITINNNLGNSDLTVRYNYKLLGTLKFIEKQINNNFLFSILHSIFKQLTLKRKQTDYKKRLKAKLKRTNYHKKQKHYHKKQ